MIRVDIETIIMASGPVPSVIVLRERGNGESANAPSRSLSIQTGSESTTPRTTVAPSRTTCSSRRFVNST